MITVDYAELTGLQSRLQAIYNEIERNLTDLSALVTWVATVWEGAAADGFRNTTVAWQQAAADLQDRLAELHNMIGTSHDNAARVVHSNSRIWAGRRS